jgi:hypothetical protein
MDILCIFGIIWILSGLITGYIFHNRGRSELLGFVNGVILGPLGIIIVLVTPIDEEEIIQKKEKVNNIVSDEKLKCPFCGESITARAIVCMYCNNDVSEAWPDFVKCPFCKEELELYNKERIEKKFICPECGTIVNVDSINKCPNCHLWNSDIAEVCDCGYIFSKREPQPKINDEEEEQNNVIEQPIEKEINPMVEEHIDNSQELLENNQLEESLSECLKAIDIDPELDYSQNLLGYIQARLGNYDDAINSFKKAIQLSPDYFKARENLRNARIGKEMETYKQIFQGNISYPMGFDNEEDIYGKSELPGYYYLSFNSYINRGFPGFRNRPGKSGYDPMDTYMEQGYMGGVLIKKLITLSLPLDNMFYLLLSFIVGLLLLSTIIIDIIIVINNLSIVGIITIITLLPYTFVGLFLLLNIMKEVFPNKNK